MLDIADFRNVSLGDRSLFFEHYERFPQVDSDNTFTNMVCWNHYAHYMHVCVKENLVLSSSIEGRTRYRPPIGPHNLDLLANLLEIATSSKDDFPIMITDSETKEWISRIYPELKLHPERKYFEYVYLSADLADLPGKKFLTIRHQLNQFKRTCSPAVELITGENIPDVFEFLDNWCEWKDCDSEPILANEKEAVFFALSHYSELQLTGLAIRVKGDIGAMALFEGLNKDTAIVHFEKGLPECKGIYRAINAETAKFLVKDYVYINRESDMGIEGIREAKMRYHPHHMVEVYSINRGELEKII